ncbi:MAG: helix-turn-helix transcriptional regulator [Oscillospiraceae bacterium]|nr:helix-turn-helix transcriptional regulator [Oscillospiraceae bacterium]
MPFKSIDVDKLIQEKLDADQELKELWDSSRTEYRLLGELITLRKARGMSQVELAQKSGHKQQVISRIENRESSPTLKTLCALADVLDVDIQIVPRHE